MYGLFRPKMLTLGQKVALIAPSSPPASTHLIDFAVSYIKSIGLIPVLGKNCKEQYGYLAGDDSLRAEDVNWAFSNGDIAGVFCLRGGYGTQRILDKLDFDIIRKNPKFFCGYSDITALHTAINQIAGFVTYHTPMLATHDFAKAGEYTLRSFHHQIFKATPNVYRNPTRQKWEFLSTGFAAGQLCGGNLSVISAGIGTEFEIQTSGKILFIEEIGEEPYKIDRMLNQLRLAGKFDELEGMIFGAFTDCEPSDKQSLTIPQIIKNLRLDIPILYNFACGHTYPTASLPMGAKARLDSATDLFEVLT
ncbi:MAG: LD-carboxypeptidase [Defluviitaleaceae bacterium]|nr:LD-carboxypeptidase [Defluviitaleaceae bacterium]